LEPDDKDGLEGEVEGKIVQDKSQGEALEEGEETKDDPICQPLHVVLMRRGLKRLEGQIGRETPSDEVGDRSGERVDEDEEGEKSDCANDCVRFGHLSPLLKLVQDRVLGELDGDVSNKNLAIRSRRVETTSLPPYRAG
jgi:hypothetical protein